MIYNKTNSPLRTLIPVFISLFIFSAYLNSIISKHSSDDNIIWKDDFESGRLSGWEIIDDISGEASNWFIEKGYLIQDTDAGDKGRLLGTNIINGNDKWDNYVVRVNLACTDDDYIGILFRYNDNNNYYRLIMSSERKEIIVDKRVDGEFITLAKYTDEEWQYVKYSATIFLNNGNIKVFLNDKQFFDINDNQFSKGKIGFTSVANLGSFFDDIIIYSQYEIKPVEINQKITRGPYLQNVLKNHAVIMWDTSLPSNTIVEYGLSKKAEWSKVSEEPVLKHEIKLENLKPETVYYYRIKSGGITSEWFSLKTAVNENTPFSFIAYSDTQMNFLRHYEITEQISKYEFDLIINCGDVVQRGPRSDWDTEFFNPLKNILKEKPIYAAIGNHELNNENFYKNFANPNFEHENYYSFKYGNSFFVFIDNPRAAYPDKTYYTDYKPGSEQYKWLDSTLASEEAQNSEWIFTVSHVPSYVAGSQDRFEGNKKYLVPLFERYGVDISFSGHVHGYERGKVNGVNYIITAGGGGTQNKKNVSKLKQYKDFKLIYNFCRIEVNDKTLVFKAYDNSNTLVDEFELNH